MKNQDSKKNKYLKLNNNIDSNIQRSIEDINNCLKKESFTLDNYDKLEKDLHKPDYYPIYPYDSADPEGFYANIYNYLYKRNIDPKGANYPKYIYNSENQENKKRLFRRKANNYEIDKNGYLCYKIPYYGLGEDNSNSSSFEEKEEEIISEKHNKKKLSNKNKNFYFEKGLYSLYIIPFKINEYTLIRNIHENINHRNWEDTRKEFKKQKYYYRGYINDIKYIVSNCTQCNQKNFKFYKKEKCKTIIFDEPKDRYVIDLTDLPNNIDNENKFKHLCNIIDHFSKLCKSYLLINKSSFGILLCIKDFFGIYGKPKSLGSDNGREFKNKLIEDYLKNNNIKFVHGFPYKPNSQGVVEIVHKTIKTGLILRKLDRNKNFDLKEALEDTVKSYNDTIHSVTKATPLEVFWSTNKKFIKSIKNNIINYYDKRSKNTFQYELDDKILISTNIIVKKMKKDNYTLIEKNKVKNDKSLYIIRAVIVKILSAGIYDVLISEDYKDYNLKKDELCRISSELFKSVSYKVWKNTKI